MMMIVYWSNAIMLRTAACVKQFFACRSSCQLLQSAILWLLPLPQMEFQTKWLLSLPLLISKVKWGFIRCAAINPGCVLFSSFANTLNCSSCLTSGDSQNWPTPLINMLDWCFLPKNPYLTEKWIVFFFQENDYPLKHNFWWCPEVFN